MKSVAHRRMSCVVVLISLCLFANGLSSPRTDPVVQTKVGAIRGVHATDGDYTMFKGIPYATIDPSNPFSAPLDRPPFNTTFDAVDDSAVCPQINGEGTFECLQLSIFVPSSASAQNRLPVMLWIHGGAFVIGSFITSRVGPKYLMKHDVIFVVINYRMSLYGFMCLDIPEAPGNAGIKDQVKALKWVKENIAAFNGDDNNITLFGVSAGATLIDLHIRYNKDDVFHKAILQSISSSIKNPNYKLAVTIANKLGHETSDSLDAVKFLSTQSPHTVLPAFRETKIKISPCVEMEFSGVERYITAYDMDMEIPRVRNTTVLIGYNDDEWFSKYFDKPPEFFETLNIFEEYLLEAFDLNDKELKEVEAVVKRFYLGDDPVSQDKFRDVANFDTDFFFVHPIEVVIRQYIENSCKDIYRYLFSYVGVRNHAKYELNITSGGAVHGDEKGYLFDISSLPEPNEEDQLMLDRLTALWTNFAKYGNPTPETTELLPMKWPVYTKEASYYLELGKKLEVKKNLFHKRVAFWDLVYLMYKNKQVGYNPGTKTIRGDGDASS